MSVHATPSAPEPAGSGPAREARIDLGAIRANVAALRDLVAPARVMVVVKADAYGHGAVPVARAAVEAGADELGVADIAEAIELRDAGIEAPILAWLHPGDLAGPFRQAVARGVELGISTPAQLEAAAEAGASAGRPAVVHLKLDTGLSRNGLAPDAADRVFPRARAGEDAGVLRVRGIFSHLSNTTPDDNALQAEVLLTLIARAEAAGLRPEVRHLAASEAALTRPDLRLDLVRVGIAVYGLPPAAGLDVAALGLRPAMELSGRIAAVRRVPLGAGVSYGYTHRTARETTLALVPLGYADGVPRAASGRAEVAIGGERFPVVGRIAMDQLVVEVGDAPVEVGDRVVLWGDPATGAPSAEQWALDAGTIGYEIVTRVGRRVPRVAIG